MLNRLKFILITALPSLLFFFFIIPNADAASTYTIYAYGSGYIMVGILQSIASVVAGGGFSLILKSVVLIGFVIIFLQMIITSFKVSPHRSLVKYFSAVLVIYSALLIPKVNVSVYDTVNNTTSNAVVVNNVPWGIGAIASYFSEFQYYMTTNIEQAFSTPNTIDLTNAGMGFALTSQNIVDGVQIDDPYLFQSFTQYVYNCVLPGISAGGLSSQALTQAGMSTTGTGNATNSLLSYMASYTAGAGANLLTTEYSAAGGDGSPSGTTTTCGAQTTDIQNDFNTYATTEAGPQMAGALGMTYATFASQYGLVNSAIYNMSSNAEDEIIQMMAVNQYSQAMIQSANLAGVNPSQLAYGSALAQQNMSDSFSISGQMAGRYMPVIYGIFSALFLAFSLFLIILMALPIGVNYLKMYMELGLFLAVWPTLMAVYNYIIDLIVQQQFTYLATQGYSLNSAHTVNTFIATQLGWMGYLSWGVPIVAYALVTGSTYAMVGAISSMDAAGKGAASSAAAQAASGNVNLGNDSMHNYSAANKSMDNLGAMDVSTGNIRRNNTTSNKYDTVKTHNTGTDLSQKHSVGTDGQTITAINPKTGQTDFTKTQDGVVSTTTTPGVGSFTTQTTGRDNTVDNLRQFNAGLRYNDSTDITTGLNKTRNNKINSNFERFKKSLKGYENLTEGLTLGKYGNYTTRTNGFTNENLGNTENNFGTANTFGTSWNLGNGAKYGNSLENASMAYAVNPNSADAKQLTTTIGRIGTQGAFSTPNNTITAGQRAVAGITSYMKKNKGLNKKWDSMSKLDQGVALEAYANAGISDGFGSDAGVKVSAKTSYNHALTWMKAHPNDTMVDFYKANMQKGYNSIATNTKLTPQQKQAEFTKLTVQNAKGAHAIMRQYGLNGSTGNNNSGSVSKKAATPNSAPVYKNLSQIKPGGYGVIKGREYYENYKGSVEEIKNKKGKTVDIPE